jgi:hypothetical protein
MTPAIAYVAMGLIAVVVVGFVAAVAWAAKNHDDQGGEFDE